MELTYLPVGLALKGKEVLIVGGGSVAEQKVKKALASGAKVTVLSPRVSREIKKREDEGSIRVARKGFSPGSTLISADLVVAATSSRDINASVSEACRRAGVPVNVVDDPSLSDFIFLAVSSFDGFFLAVSSDGRNPGVSARIREFFDENREEIQKRVVRGKRYTAEKNGLGKVYLAGAGPGAPDLLTVRALAAIKSADVIIKDYLVPGEVIGYSGTRAKVISLDRKGVAGHSVRIDRQDYVNRLMVRLARSGKVVVRLKSGDPFVFGRGGEEMEYLESRGVTVEVIPGITAAIGAAAEAGIPLTHRDYSSSVLFITGKENPGKGECSVDLKCLPAGATVVSYMSVANVQALKDKFLRDGVPEGTPAAIVEKASWPDQRVIHTTVGKIDEAVRDRGVTAPALIIAGNAVAVSSRIMNRKGETVTPVFGQDTG
ncbi:MAG: uroporphyrinogen-III C-methyltransferase [Deltaproteobacteria bacterium]|nr:uroporphyrinogen-III C-methyltransferase [Deltaproteobacteria bacterium]NIS77213.1 uroporphyrinogen-III C-methyltransferase [Deltaproteobacteria bacterium]